MHHARPIVANVRAYEVLLPIAATLAGGLAAAAEEPMKLEEITVTARRTEERLLDVPIAVTAVSAATLEAYNIDGLRDLSAITPSFYIMEFAGGRQDRNYVNLMFRGMNFFSPLGLVDAAVLFMDGAPVLGGQLATIQNIDRIEVLPGPQTAQFGRNTMTGAVNIVTKLPGNEWLGDLRGELDQEGSTDFSGSIEGPILADRVAFRLAAGSRRYVGSWKNNATGGTLGDRATDAASLTLLFTPNDDVSLKLFTEYSEYDDGPSATYLVRGDLYGDCNIRGTAANDYFCGEVNVTGLAESVAADAGRVDEFFRTQIIDRYSIFGETMVNGPGLAAENLKVHAILDWKTPWAGTRFKAIAAKHSSDLQTVEDSSTEDQSAVACVRTATVPCNRPFFLWQAMFERAFDDFSIEARLESDPDRELRWVVGANYVDLDGQTGNGASEVPPSFGGIARGPTQGRTLIETLGAFGGLYWKLGERSEIGAELRSQQDDVESVPFVPVIDSSGRPITSFQETFDNVSGRLTFKFKPSEDMTLFANLSNGYRPGTFNNRIPTLPPASQAILASRGATVAVDEETLEQFEFGWRGSLLESRLQASVVGYVGTVKDQQITNFELIPIVPGGPPTSFSYIGNTGESDIHGVEIESTAILSDSWRLNFAGSWNHLEIKKSVCGNCAPFGNPGTVNINTAQIGKMLPSVPEYKASLALDYSRPFGAENSWYGRAEYLYQSKLYADEVNLAHSGDRNIVNLRTGLELGSTSVELYLQNATDDTTVVGIQRAAHIPSFYDLTPYLALPERRRLGLKVMHQF
jgi:iron complex outermembrane receptor protein